MFRIVKLQEIADHSGKTLFEARQRGIIGGAIYTNIRNSMKNGDPIDNLTLRTIGRLAKYFDCHPMDFLEYVPDDSIEAG